MEKGPQFMDPHWIIFSVKPHQKDMVTAEIIFSLDTTNFVNKLSI